MIKLEVSMGEAFDKYSILKLKLENITDKDKLIEIEKELSKIKIDIDQYRYYYNLLYKINKSIWELTDQVKKQPNITIYNEIFLKNEARFRVKSKINLLTRSFIVEQKSYPLSTLIIYNDDSINDKEIYIRYLSICYDCIIIYSLTNINLFINDPHVIIKKGKEGIDLSTLNIEPIPNLLM